MQAKAYKGISMEGGIARWYTAITRKDMAEFDALAHRMAADLPPTAQVLEVAPGPGYFAIALAGLGAYGVTGLDISASFVRIASENAADAGVTAEFRQGNAAEMPFATDRFDLIFCRAAFKNFTDPVGALGEMRRVLKPGGRAVIIDMRSDAARPEIDRYVDGLGLGAPNRIATKAILLWLRKRAYSEAEYREFIAAAGFGDPKISASATGFEIVLTKSGAV